MQLIAGQEAKLVCGEAYVCIEQVAWKQVNSSLVS